MYKSYHKIRQKNIQGFTLIEVLISFFLIMILILGMAQLTFHSILVKRRSDYSVKSAELASSKLEYFKSLSYESEELREGSEIEILEANNPKGRYRREWKIQDISPDMKKIEMECNFENCPEKKAQIVLFLSRDIGF